MSENSEKDKIFGRQAEKEFACWLIMNRDILRISFYDGKAYDLEAIYKNGYRVLYEVKNDKYESDNVAIEFSCNGESSGINATTSNLWVHKVRGEFYVILTNHLREMIEKNKYPEVPGGDFKNSMMYLIPAKEFKEKAYNLEEYNASRVRKNAG